jgi:phosphonoacetaldehyde hydrolase
MSLALTEAQARGPMGLGKRDHIAALLADPAVRSAWLAGHGQPPAADTTDQLYAAFASRLPPAVEAHADVIPGVIEVVEQLRAVGIGVGSTTGYPRAVAERVARAAATQGLVMDVRLATDDVPAGRPAPWMLYRVLERLGSYPPAAVVKVGDTGVDMAEGRNAGTWCVGVTETGNELGLGRDDLEALPAPERATRRTAAALHLTKAGAHLAIASVAELPAAMADLQARLDAGERP